MSVFRTVINFPNHPVFTKRARLHRSVFVLWPLPGVRLKAHSDAHRKLSSPSSLSRSLAGSSFLRRDVYGNMPSELTGFTPADTGQTGRGLFALCKKLPAGNALDEKLMDRRNAGIARDLSRWINACSIIRKMQLTRDTYYLDKVPPKDFLSREMN